MWTTQKHVPRWDLPAGLAGAQLGVKTPLPIHEGASRHTESHMTSRVPQLQHMPSKLLFTYFIFYLRHLYIYFISTNFYLIYSILINNNNLYIYFIRIFIHLSNHHKHGQPTSCFWRLDVCHFRLIPHHYFNLEATTEDKSIVVSLENV